MTVHLAHLTLLDTSHHDFLAATNHRLAAAHHETALDSNADVNRQRELHGIPPFDEGEGPIEVAEEENKPMVLPAMVGAFGVNTLVALWNILSVPLVLVGFGSTVKSVRSYIASWRPEVDPDVEGRFAELGALAEGLLNLASGVVSKDPLNMAIGGSMALGSLNSGSSALADTIQDTTGTVFGSTGEENDLP